MAFTKDQNKELKIATMTAQEMIDSVADSQGAQEIVSGISKKTKMIVYFIGDTMLWAAAVTPQVVSFVVAVGSGDVFSMATNLNSFFATSGLFLLTMFGIYKSGQK